MSTIIIFSPRSAALPLPLRPQGRTGMPEAPHNHDHGYGRQARTPAPAAAAPSEREVRDATQAVRQSREFFSRYGLGEQHGNGLIDVAFDREFPSAGYLQDERGREAVIVGADEKTGISYAHTPDVIAHEYAHRIVDKLLGLRDGGETGAVSESLADTFAAAIDPKNWTIGEGARPGGIRSMANPSASGERFRTRDGVVPMPDHISEYVHTSRDNGGVHINVGIPNKAAAQIGQQLGRTTMADIYMHAVVKHMNRDSGIVDTARATMQSAIELFGAQSRELSVVRDAWNSVGVTSSLHRPRARQSDSLPRY